MPFDARGLNPATVVAREGGALTTATMAALRASSAAFGNDPSEDHLAALEAVARTMEAMANGTCPPAVYLASLDPGIGKTEAAKHFARALVASEEHRGVGMVICLGRLTQVEEIARTIELPHGRMAVLTGISNENLNALSMASVEDAQVLLTTQQGTERRSNGGFFETIDAFRFRGAPRAVRVWDEALEVAAPITVLWSAGDGLAQVAMRRSPEFAEAVARLATKLQTHRTGEVIAVPDFEANHGISWWEIEAALDGGDDDQLQAARSLRALNGTTARVYRENKRGAVIVSFEQRIPDDIRPILVLDASIRVRQTYLDMEHHRDGFVRLPTAVKDYGDLTVHLWQTSGSKTAFSNRGPEIVQGVVETILTKPNETWLVVTHKPSSKVKNIEALVTAALPTNIRPNVSFLTFGNHMATNDHAAAANVMLAGQFFAPTSHYAALTLAAQGRDASTGMVSADEIEATRQGELADVTLQAISRGRCRKSVGAKAYPMNTYIMATARSGIPAALGTIFPGCKVISWEPFKKGLKGNTKRAVEYVRGRLDAGQTVVPYAKIRDALGIEKANFSHFVSSTDDWLNALEEMDCEVHRGKRNALSVRFIDADAPS